MRIKRPIFSILLVIVLHNTAIAQSSIELGMGPCQMLRPYWPEERYDDNFAITLGYHHAFKLSEHWHLQPGFNLLYYRMQYNIFLTHQSFGFSYITSEKTTHDYISFTLPLFAECRFKHFGIYAGPCLEYKLYEVQTGGNYEKHGDYKRTFYNPDFLKNGNNILGQLGVSWWIKPYLTLNALASYGKQLRYGWLSLSYVFRKKASE